MRHVTVLLLGLTWISHTARASGSLVLRYRFEKGKGAVVSDVSGSANHGQIHGPKWTKSGRVGNALVFDGVNDYVRSNTYPLNPGKTNFSASVWFKALHVIDYYWGIVTQTNKQGQGRFWINLAKGGYLRTKIGNPDDAPVIQGKTKLQKGKWYHAVITYKKGAIKLYLDGKLEASGTDKAESTLGDTVLGSHKALNTSFFNGIVDELQIYKKALSQAEVTFLYKNPALVIGASQDAGVGKDAGSPQDAGPSPDAGSGQSQDAGPSQDAGVLDKLLAGDGGRRDASMHQDAAADGRPGDGCAVAVSTPARGPLIWVLAVALLWLRRRHTRRTAG